MKTIWDASAKEELLNRVEQLSPESQAQWGKMDVSQMLWHCKYPLSLAVKNENKGNGQFFMKLFKKSLYSDKPFKQGLPTAKFLVATESKNFSKEKSQIIDLVNKTHELKSRDSWNPHPIFGKLTHEQWGKMEYKHLDHHFKQFGV